MFWLHIFHVQTFRVTCCWTATRGTCLCLSLGFLQNNKLCFQSIRLDDSRSKLDHQTGSGGWGGGGPEKDYGPISNEHEIFIQTIVSHCFGFTSFMFRRFASHAAGQQPEAPAFVYRSASSKITSCVSSPFGWTIRDPNWIIKLALPPLPTRAGGPKAPRRLSMPSKLMHCAEEKQRRSLKRKF